MFEIFIDFLDCVFLAKEDAKRRQVKRKQDLELEHKQLEAKAKQLGESLTVSTNVLTTFCSNFEFEMSI